MKLDISRLVVNFENAHGHEHRIYDITSRAATTFVKQVEARLAISDNVPRSLTLDRLTASAVSLDLNHTGDEQVATQIAGAWLEALAPHLMG
jgi:hypothetical protein